MRLTRLLIALPILFVTSLPYAQSGSSGSVGKLVAPGLEVVFSQSGRNSCTWRFRNADPARTLESMRFTYSWSASPLARVPPSTSTSSSNSGEDTLTDPLQPFEVSSSRDLYQAPAPCVSVTIRVTATQWM
jgi:hypothetical protein